MTKATQAVPQCGMVNVTTTVKDNVVKTDSGEKILFSSPVMEGVARFANFYSVDVSVEFLIKRSSEMARQLRHVMDNIHGDEPTLKDMTVSTDMQDVLVDVPSYFAPYLEYELDKMGFVMYQPVYNEVNGTVVTVV